MDSGLDGSDHHWFEDRGPRCCLEHHGKPVAFYSDKAAERISTWDGLSAQILRLKRWHCCAVIRAVQQRV